MIFAIPLLMVAACNVDSDATNEQVTVNYDRERIKKSASDAARAASVVASGAANVATSAGRAIKNEVGDVDVDVKVTRNRSSEAK